MPLAKRFILSCRLTAVFPEEVVADVVDDAPTEPRKESLGGGVCTGRSTGSSLDEVLLTDSPNILCLGGGWFVGFTGS